VIGGFENGRMEEEVTSVEVWRWKKKCGVLHPSPEGGDILQRLSQKVVATNFR
jgi:hypothetical protein